MRLRRLRLPALCAGVLGLVTVSTGQAGGARQTVGGSMYRPDATGAANPSDSGPQVVRISDVRLNPGGFQPCPDSNLPLGMPVGQRNPDAAYLKCVTASVTVEVVQGAGGGYPNLAGALEGWGFSVIDGRRYDYRSPVQHYPGSYVVGAVGAPGLRSWTWNALAVTYYDGKLEWANPSQPGSLAGNSVPVTIRDRLRTEGASLELSIPGASAPPVRCRYFGPVAPAPDRLVCDGLPHDRPGPRERMGGDGPNGLH